MDRYFVIVRKAADSDFSVEVPDLPGCFTAGVDLDEARTMAAEAIRFHLDEMAKDGEEAPSMSSLSAIESALTADLRGDDFFGILDVEVRREPTKSVRVNITMDEGLLAEVDAKAELAGMTRSGFLAEAARRFAPRR